VRDKRIVGGSAFGLKDSLNSGLIHSVSAKPVNRFGGESYQSASSNYLRRQFNCFLLRTVMV